jgi:hypothetical protein
MDHVALLVRLRESTLEGTCGEKERASQVEPAKRSSIRTGLLHRKQADTGDVGNMGAE